MNFEPQAMAGGVNKLFLQAVPLQRNPGAAVDFRRQYAGAHGVDGGQLSLQHRSIQISHPVRGFTHRQAEKARDFGDRQNARYGSNTKPTTDPEDGVRK